MKLNKSETRVLEMIEKYGSYTAVTYEKRLYNASKSLVEKGLCVILEAETWKKTAYYNGRRDTWYQFKIAKAVK